MNNCVIKQIYNNSNKSNNSNNSNKSNKSNNSKSNNSKGKNKKKEIIIETEEMSQECIEDINKNKEETIKRNKKKYKNEINNSDLEFISIKSEKKNKKIINKNKDNKEKLNKNKDNINNKEIINNLMDYNFEEDKNKNLSLNKNVNYESDYCQTTNETLISEESYDLKVEKYAIFMDNYKNALCNLIDYVKSLNIIPIKVKIKLPFIKKYINDEENDDELLTNGIEHLLGNKDLIINFNINNIYDFNEVYSKVNKKNEFLDLIDEFVMSIKKKKNQIEKENIDVIKALFEYIFKLLQDIVSLFE